MRFVLMAIMLNGIARAGAELPGALAPRALVPSRMQAAVNETVELRIASLGPAEERAAPWPENEIAWFFSRSDGKQTNRDTLAASTPDGQRAVLSLPDAGVSMIGVQFKPQVLTLDDKQFAELRGRFAAQTDEKRSDRQPAPGAQQARVRVQSAAAALIRVKSGDASADEPSAIATSKSGQKAEIRPMFDPTRCKAEDELPVRVYADGDKAAGALVRAIQPDGKAVTSTSNPAGFATIAITAPGVWRIELQQLVPARGDPDADWVLYLGSLTFQTADAQPAGQGGTR